jgi:hypothetical protein
MVPVIGYICVITAVYRKHTAGLCRPTRLQPIKPENFNSALGLDFLNLNLNICACSLILCSVVKSDYETPETVAAQPEDGDPERKSAAYRCGLSTGDRFRHPP